MKVILTKKEVEEIVVSHINTLLGAEFDKCEISTYSYREDYCVVTTVEPEVVAVAEEQP